MADKHNFNEKKTEHLRGKDIPVIETPKFKQSKAKAIEMIDKGDYGLADGDFWILMNTDKAGQYCFYTGLIISHNGCLKINDKLADGFKAEYLTREWLKDTLIYEYNDGTLYEVGEVSADNCKNAYPYAMAFKRCFDRVVLKKSKLAFDGIYSEVEADEFKHQEEEPKEEKTESVFDTPITNKRSLKILADEFRRVLPQEEQDRILAGLNYKKAEDIGTVDLEKYINFFKYGKKQASAS